ncbi:MAG: hypothetical protein ACOYJI_00260 [Anaerovoracaceae bacterium]|jgi:hypothetical protein
MMNLIMAVVSLIVPFIYIFGGILFVNRPPRFGKRGIAYKSKRACLSEKTWEYSNHSFGVVSIFMGIYLAAFTGLVDAILKYFQTSFAWAATAAMICIQILLVLVPINYIEKHLKIYFDENGNDMYPEELDIKDKKTDDDWEDWSTWPGDAEKDKEDGWVDWDTWLKKRDEELDRERAMKAASENGSSGNDEAAGSKGSAEKSSGASSKADGTIQDSAEKSSGAGDESEDEAGARSNAEAGGTKKDSAEKSSRAVVESDAGAGGEDGTDVSGGDAGTENSGAENEENN